MNNVINFPPRPDMRDYRPSKRVENALDAMGQWFAVTDDAAVELSIARRQLQDERRISDQNFAYAQAAEATLNKFKASWLFRVHQFFERRKK